MARLLNRPMSGSTDLVNLLGQRGQQQAQSSLAMSQPWTAAAQNIGGQAAKTLTDRYAAEQARPAQAFKLMQALQTLEQGAESLKIAKSTETRAASDAAKMNVGGALLQASNMKNPAEQAAAYQKALGVMQQHDLTAFQAPQDTQWGTPAAYSYLRKTAYNLDDKLKPTSDRERILERKRQELGGDLTPEQRELAFMEEATPSMRPTWGRLDGKSTMAFAITGGKRMGQIVVSGPGGQLINVADRFEAEPPSSAMISPENIKSVADLIGRGKMSLHNVSARYRHLFVPESERVYNMIHSPEMRGKCPECDGSGATFDAQRGMLEYEAARGFVQSNADWQPRLLFGAFREFDKQSKILKGLAYEMRQTGWTGLNNAIADFRRNYRAKSPEGILAQKYYSAWLNLKTAYGTIIANGKALTVADKEQLDESFPRGTSYEAMDLLLEQFKSVADARLKGFSDGLATPYGTFGMSVGQPAQFGQYLPNQQVGGTGGALGGLDILEPTNSLPFQ